MNTVDTKTEEFSLSTDDKITLFFSGVLLALIFGYLGGLL